MLSTKSDNTVSPAPVAYANGINFWRRRAKKTWRQLALESRISVNVLHRTAKTPYTLYVNPANHDVIAVSSGSPDGGTLGTEKLIHLANLLNTSLTDILKSPEELQKIFPSQT